MYLLILEVEEGREEAGGRETLLSERNINWLPPTHVLSRDQIRSLLVYGMKFQLTKPHWPEK